MARLAFGFYDVTKLFKEFPKYRVLASERHTHEGVKNVIKVIVSDLHSFRLVMAFPMREVLYSRGITRQDEVRIADVVSSHFDKLQKAVA